MGFGYVEGVNHDYVRHGTTTLFAALNVLNGAVLATCKPRHRHQEFLSFLRKSTRPYRLNSTCTASWTTMAVTSIPRSRRGSQQSPAGTCISSLPTVRGSIRSNASFR